MSNNKKSMVKDLKIILEGNNLNYRKFTTSEIGRGIGVFKPGKGKGSYIRKQKHKERMI